MRNQNGFTLIELLIVLFVLVVVLGLGVLIGVLVYKHVNSEPVTQTEVTAEK